MAFCCFILTSCKRNEVKKMNVVENLTEKKFKMYAMSEMAMLMEQMYVENKRLKARIIKGDAVENFPEYFNKIFTSKLSDPSDNDIIFKTNAAHFIEVQKKLYSNVGNVKENYNNGINACITCHQGKCGGPLIKIKKLLLK